MLLKLLLLFTVVPMVELYLLLWIAEWTGSAALTFGLVILTGIVGAFLAKQQGIRVLSRLRQEFASSQLPTDSILDGLMILVAGALLITPGVLTDAFGFSLLLPPVRGLLRKALKSYFRNRIHVQTWAPGQGPSPAQRHDRDIVIDSHVVEGTQQNPDESG